MVKKLISGASAKTVQSPRHVLIASVLFSSSLLLGSFMFNAKAHAADGTQSIEPSVNVSQNVSDTATSENVTTAGAGQTQTNQSRSNAFDQSSITSVSTGQQVIDNTQQPATEVQQTATDMAQTATEVQQTAADTAQTATEVQPAATVTQQPATEVQQAEPDMQQPATDTSHSVTDPRSSTNSAVQTPVATVETVAQALPAMSTVAPVPLGSTVIKNITYNVPIPTNGTNAITATNAFNVSLNTSLQWVNVHPPLKAVGQLHWQSYEYASNIPMTAAGIDDSTKFLYLDEWMPDTALQYIIYLTNYTGQYISFPDFRNRFDKATLSTMTSLVTEESLQSVDASFNPSPYFIQMMRFLQTLEGMQYATSLQNLKITNDLKVTRVAFQTTSDIHGNLWDITALSGLPNLTNVEINGQTVQDISPLRTLPNLKTYSTNYNSISDASNINVNYKIPNNGGLRYQWIPIAPILLPLGTTSVQIDFNVIAPDGSQRVAKPYNGTAYPNDSGYNVIASTADGVNVGPNTVVFSNILTPPTGRTGVLTVHFPFWGYDNVTPDTAPDAFDGYITIPYVMSNDYSMMNMKYDYLQSDGQQVSIGPNETLVAGAGTNYNIINDAQTTYPMTYLIDRLGSNYIVLNGTGKYSDYVAQNGLANRVNVTGTIPNGVTNMTVIFAGTTESTVAHGYWNGTVYVPIGSSGTFTNGFNTSTLIADLVQPIPYHTFSGAVVVNSDGTSTPVTSTTVPYLMGGSYLQLVYVADSVTISVSYVDASGNPIAADGSLTGVYNTQIPSSDLASQQIPINGYRFDHFAKADGTPITGAFTFEDVIDGLHAVYRTSLVIVAIKYVDQQGNPLAPDVSLTGIDTDPVTTNLIAATTIPINGYTFKQVQAPDGTVVTLPTTFENLPTTLMLVYAKNQTPSTGNPSDPTPEKPVTPGSPALMGKVIYALDAISLYYGPNFDDSFVLTSYVKKPRIYRPRFKVVGWALDKQNRLRYQVRDINEKSETYGLTGYISSDPLLVRGAYYQIAPSEITVLNPKGINGYTTVNLKGKLAHYKQGTVLKVQRVITGRTATRFVLTDGSYVTANKELVKMGHIEMPVSATQTKALNRYDNLQLTKRNHHYKTIAPQTFKIKGWDYSNGYDYHVKSLKRYLVSGGYITAYSVLVTAKF